MDEPVADADGTLAAAHRRGAPPLARRRGARARRGLARGHCGHSGRQDAQAACCRSSDAQRILAGIAEGSPYLWELARADPARLAVLLASDPDAPLRGNPRRRRARDRRDRRRRRGDAAAAAHEGGGGAADRARRYRRRVAGDARHRRADRACRRGGRRGGSASSRRAPRGRAGWSRAIATGRRTAAATSCSPWARWARASSTIRATSTSSCSTTPRRPRLRAGDRAGAVLRAAHARAGEAAAGAHRRRLRVPHRPAAAARSGLDPDRDLDRGGARLLRERRAELGARGADQGARLRRRHRGGRSDAARALRRSSGANISTSPRSPTSTR